MAKDTSAPETRSRNRTPVADTLFAFFLIVLATGLFWLASTPPYVPHPAAIVRTARVPPERLSTSAAAMRGADHARVALIEFSDFQCPFSATFARDFVPALEKKYIQPGLMRLVFMHLPLVTIHREAFAAAAAAQCAVPGDRFWQMHHVLFLRQSDIGLLGVRQLAADAGVGTDAAFEKCLSDVTTRATIADQTAVAYEFGLQLTPSFLLGHITDRSSVRVVRRFAGIPSFQELDSAIAALIASAEPSLAAGEERASER